jgi:hypothetical protein
MSDAAQVLVVMVGLAAIAAAWFLSLAIGNGFALRQASKRLKAPAFHVAARHRPQDQDDQCADCDVIGNFHSPSPRRP